VRRLCREVGYSNNDRKGIENEWRNETAWRENERVNVKF